MRALALGARTPPDFEDVVLRLVGQRKLQMQLVQPATDEEPPVVALRLTAGRDGLAPHEAALVNALFGDGREVTTTELQTHYRGRDFDPDEVVQGAFESAYPAPKAAHRSLFALLRLALLAGGATLAVRELQAADLDLYVLMAGLGGGFIVAGLMPRGFWRGGTLAAMGVLLVPLTVMSAATVLLALVPNRPLGAGASVALAALMLGHFAGFLSGLPRPSG